MLFLGYGVGYIGDVIIQILVCHADLHGDGVTMCPHVY